MKKLLLVFLGALAVPVFAADNEIVIGDEFERQTDFLRGVSLHEKNPLVSDARTKFLKSLVDEARGLGGTRLVSAAMEVRGDPQDSNHKIVDDPFGEFTDLCSFNEYVGWYDGLPDKIDRIRWSIKYDKPVVISEFGADARTRFSKEYQADVYRRTLPMLEKIPGFSGYTPWILNDFRSPRRLLPKVQDGWNIKGLISHDGRKKEAFFVLQKIYGEMQNDGTSK